VITSSKTEFKIKVKTKLWFYIKVSRNNPVLHWIYAIQSDRV